LAVQWHPELLTKPDPTFQWLVREASARRSS
jgi:gamma-glutamyl-gamma-aminobutyrate hydrolase PuuD